MRFYDSCHKESCDVDHHIKHRAKSKIRYLLIFFFIFCSVFSFVLSQFTYAQTGEKTPRPSDQEVQTICKKIRQPEDVKKFLNQLRIVKQSLLNPTTELLVERADRYIKEQQFNDALKSINEAIFIESKSLILYIKRAEIYKITDNTNAEALADIQFVLKQNPNNLLALIDSVDLFEQDKLYKHAYQSWKKVTEICPLIENGQVRLQQLSY